MKVVSPTLAPFGSVKARTRQVPVGTAELQRQRQAAAAGALIRQQRRGDIRRRPAARPRASAARRSTALPCAVAQQRGEIDGLAGAIDAALGIDEGIERRPAPRGPATPRSVRSKAGALQAEEGVVGRVAGRPSAAPATARPRRAPARLRTAHGPIRRSCGWRGFRCCAAISRTSALAIGSVEASELTKTWMPSLPENAVRPRSETMNHCVASEPPDSSSAGARRPSAPPSSHRRRAAIRRAPDRPETRW